MSVLMFGFMLSFLFLDWIDYMLAALVLLVHLHVPRFDDNIQFLKTYQNDCKVPSLVRVTRRGGGAVHDKG